MRDTLVVFFDLTGLNPVYRGGTAHSRYSRVCYKLSSGLTGPSEAPYNIYFTRSSILMSEEKEEKRKRRERLNLLKAL